MLKCVMIVLIKRFMQKMNNLTNQELEKIYKIVKAVDEGLLVNPQEEWELDYYDEKLIDRKGLKQILKKLKSSAKNGSIGKAEKDILVRKYDTFNNIIDENIERNVTKAFENKLTLEIEYFSMERAEFNKRKIDIYAKNSKYIAAYCHSKKGIRKFRISRIGKVKITQSKYEIPVGFNKKDYL